MDISGLSPSPALEYSLNSPSGSTYPSSNDATLSTENIPLSNRYISLVTGFVLGSLKATSFPPRALTISSTVKSQSGLKSVMNSNQVPLYPSLATTVLAILLLSPVIA